VSLPVELVSVAVSESGAEVALSVVAVVSEIPVDERLSDKLSEEVEVSDALEASSVVETAVVVELSSSVEGPGVSVIVGPVTVEVAPGDAEGSEVSCDVVSETPREVVLSSDEVDDAVLVLVYASSVETTVWDALVGSEDVRDSVSSRADVLVELSSMGSVMVSLLDVSDVVRLADVSEMRLDAAGSLSSDVVEEITLVSEALVSVSWLVVVFTVVDSSVVLPEACWVEEDSVADEMSSDVDSAWDAEVVVAESGDSIEVMVSVLFEISVEEVPVELSDSESEVSSVEIDSLADVDERSDVAVDMSVSLLELATVLSSVDKAEVSPVVSEDWKSDVEVASSNVVVSVISSDIVAEAPGVGSSPAEVELASVVVSGRSVMESVVETWDTVSLLSSDKVVSVVVPVVTLSSTDPVVGSDDAALVEALSLLDVVEVSSEMDELAVSRVGDVVPDASLDSRLLAVADGGTVSLEVEDSTLEVDEAGDVASSSEVLPTAAIVE
jgi:hypothetical protein